MELNSFSTEVRFNVIFVFLSKEPFLIVSGQMIMFTYIAYIVRLLINALPNEYNSY